jgi:hypothetical protein
MARLASAVRSRSIALAFVVLVMLVIALAQAAISYSMAFGSLHRLVPHAASVAATAFAALRFALLALLLLLWLLNRKRALFRAVVVANGFFTLALLLETASLLSVLAGITPRSVQTLIIDVGLMAVSNILVFSIWYWIVDPPGVEGGGHDDQPWAFLFPQRASALPHFAQWTPEYHDYLFVAFTTSFAFSPTDAAPLTPAAKMLMLLQAAISVVTLTAIAGSAINVLAGAS